MSKQNKSWLDDLEFPKYQNGITVKDNFDNRSKQNRGFELLRKETDLSNKDRAELNKTGKIKSPRSLKYQRNILKPQAKIYQDNKSDKERVASQRAMEKVHNDKLYLEKPLIYLANPDKALGDAGLKGFDTSEKDREEIMLNRHNPYQNRSDQFKNNLEQGLSYVPEAAINVGVASLFGRVPVGGSSLGNTLRLANETINPLAGSGDQLLRLNSTANRYINNRLSRQSAIHETKRLAKESALGGTKEFYENEIADKAKNQYNSIETPKQNRVFNYVKNKFGNKNESSLDAETWMKEWYSDPIIKERAEKYNGDNFFNFNANDKISIANQNLSDYKDKNYLNLWNDKGFEVYKSNLFNSNGLSYGKSDEIYVKSNLAFNFDNKKRQSVKVRELTHLAEKNGKMFNYQDNEALQKPFAYNEHFTTEQDPQITNKELLENIKYYTDPTEIHARMQQARFELGIKPKDVFKEKDFDRIQRKNNWFGMGEFISDKKGFIDLMNDFYTPAGVSLGVGAGVNQMNNQKEPSSMKNGGNVVSDEMGQWNHPGEITRISGGNITMKPDPRTGKALEQSLMGISDKGEKQIMHPGKDYKFKNAKHVTEYPIAKNGSKLSNFTKSINWLDNL